MHRRKDTPTHGALAPHARNKVERADLLAALGALELSPRPLGLLDFRVHPARQVVLVQENFRIVPLGGARRQRIRRELAPRMDRQHVGVVDGGERVRALAALDQHCWGIWGVSSDYYITIR